MFTRPGKLHVYHGDTNWWMPQTGGCLGEMVIHHQINGHLRIRLIGGTYHIYIWPSFQAYVGLKTYGTGPPSVGS